MMDHKTILALRQKLLSGAITGRQWLEARTDKPHWVEVPRAIDPTDAPGDHISAGIAPNTRTYAFATPEEAKVFQDWFATQGQLK